MSLPLPGLTYYRLAPISPAAATAAALVDCFHTAFTVTTDYRGRTLASTHQWTGGARYQNAGTTEAAYVFKPSGSPMTVSPGILVAAAAAAGSATFQTDSFLASGLHAGIGKNVGAYNAWNAANPFTSGQWGGFNRVCPTTMNATAAVVVPYVSEESWFFDCYVNATTHHPFFAGAFAEGRTDDPNSCTEDDSRLYGVCSQGSAAALSTTFLSSVGSGAFLDCSTGTTGASHCWVYQPDVASTYNCGRRVILQAAPTAGNEVDMANTFVGEDIPVARITSSAVAAGKPIGRFREVYYLGVVQANRTLWTTIAGTHTDLFHVVGCDNTTSGHALCLPAVA